MTTGLALVVIFVLYLIDKHNRWFVTLKIVSVLIILGFLTSGVHYGYTSYEEHREKVRVLGVLARRDAAIKACLARFPSLPDRKNAWLSGCEENPDSKPCWSKPNDKGFQFDQNGMRDISNNPIPLDPKNTCSPLAAGSTIGK